MDSAPVEPKKFNVDGRRVLKTNREQQVSVEQPGTAPEKSRTDNRHLFIMGYSTVLVASTFFLTTMLERRAPVPNKVVVRESSASVQAISPVTQLPAQIQNNKYVINPVCTFSEGVLFNSDLIKVIPFDTDLFFETSDPKKFMDEFLSSNIITDQKFIKFSNDNKDNFTGPSGLFIIKKSDIYIYGFVSKLKTVPNMVELAKEYDVVLINDFIVLTTDKEVLADVEDAGNGISKNLGQNPTYASAKSVLIKDGHLAIIPITKLGNGFLYQLLDKKLSDEMSSIVNNFLDSKLDYAVVL
jgi:hypothetical protein